MFRGRKKIIKAKVFDTSYDDATILPGGRWAAYVNFHIIGESDKKVHDAVIYAQVCSPAYKVQPGEDPVDDKTIVLDFLDKAYLERIIAERVQEINDMRLDSWVSYYDELEKTFDVDD